MRNPHLQNKSQMPLIERDEKVQAFASHRSAESLAHRIRLGRSHRSSQHAHSHRFYLFVKLLGKDTVPVVNEELISMFTRQGFAELLQGPVRRRMRSHVVMEDPARAGSGANFIERGTGIVSVKWRGN